MTTTISPSTTSMISRGLGWSTASNLVLRVGNFCVSIIMARLIAPEQFGVFAVALTVWTVLGSLAEFGLGTDLIRAPDMERRIPTVATLGLLASGMLAGAMALAAPLIADAFGSPASTGVIRLMAVSMALFGFTIVPAAVLQRAFRQGVLFAINGSALVASTVTMTVLAVLGYGPVALALGQIASQLVVVVGQYLATGLRLRLGFDRRVAVESARFCVPLASANLLSWVLLSIDNVIVSRVLGPVELGLYVLAFNVSSWPMSAVGQAIRVIALPAFARMQDTVRRGEAVVLVIGPVWGLAALLGIGLGTAAGPVVDLLYGGRWSEASAALVGLAAFGAVRVVFDLVATFLIAAGETRAVLTTQVVWLAAMVPTMWLGVSLFGLAGAGWAHLAVALVVTLPAYLVCLRRVGVSPGAFLRSATLPTLVALPATVVCVLGARAASGPLLGLVLVGVCAFLLYVLPLVRWWVGRVRLLRSEGGRTADHEMETA